MNIVPELDIEKFRKTYPEFRDETAFPDERIIWANEYAKDLLDNKLYCGGRLSRMLELMTAHILSLMGAGASNSGDDETIGTANGAVISATIGDVSVSFAAAPAKDSWQHWLQMSSYGQLLAALMRKQSAGGLYFGGSPEASAFRRVGGRFR